MGVRSRPDLAHTNMTNKSLGMTNSSWEKDWILLVSFERQHLSHGDKMLSYVAGEQGAVLGLQLFCQIPCSTYM